MTIKAFIFDLDGTLCDSLAYCLGLVKECAGHVTGRTVAHEEISQFLGVADRGIIRYLSGEHFEKAYTLYLERFKDNHYMCPTPFDGLEDVLKQLKASGIRLGIVTGRGEDTTRITLEHIGIGHYFEHIAYGDDDRAMKAHFIGMLVKKWQLRPEEVVYVGDSFLDILESRDSGVIPVSAAWAKTANVEKLQAYDPEHLFLTVSDFAEWVDTAVLAKV